MRRKGVGTGGEAVKAGMKVFFLSVAACIPGAVLPAKAVPVAPIIPKYDAPALATPASAPSSDPISDPFPFPIPTIKAPSSLALPGIKRFRRADFDPGRLLAQVREMRNGTLPLDLGNGARWDLDLERVSIRSPGYRVRLITSEGIRDVASAPEQSFRGRIRGKPASKVRLSFAEGRITGFIDAGDGQRTFLEPLDGFDARLPRSAHAVYTQADMEPSALAACGWTPDGTAPDLQKLLPFGTTALPFGTKASPGGAKALPGGVMDSPGSATIPSRIQSIHPPALSGLAKSAAQTSAGAAEPCGLVEIAVAAEYSMVVGWGSPAAVEKRINDVFAMVQGLYEDPRLNINIKISELFIEAEARQTWGAMNINSYLTNITPWARSSQGFKNPYDVVNLWFYQPLTTSGTTGLAYVGTVCNKSSGGNVVRDFTRTASFLMINQAHELGHNFGARHVNNTKALLNPTILGNNVAWDDTTITTIVNHKKSRTCLSSCNVGPTAGFLVDSKSPCSDTRTFTDVSKGDPTSWSWNFGDGRTSMERNPTHIYASAGSFTVQLTAANAVGSNQVSKSEIKVKPYPAPTAKGANSCVPASLTLTSAGTGTLKWYEQAVGGAKVGEGPEFKTPSLTQTRMYYVQNGDPDPEVNKVGPAANTIGAGQYFTANSERRMYFDVKRPALLRSAKVYATGAGPRTIEILDQDEVRVAARTVQVPAGESRIALDIELEPGHDYAIKYAGAPDSLNLFRNSAGADFPYRSEDSLVTITHSDATSSDNTSQSGYYYFFYDWEVQERSCGSARVAVKAEIACVPLASESPAASADLRSLGRGLFRLTGFALEAQAVEYRVIYLDGREARRRAERIGPGAFAVDLDLAGLGPNLYLVEVRQGGSRTLAKLIGF